MALTGSVLGCLLLWAGGGGAGIGVASAMPDAASPGTPVAAALSGRLSQARVLPYPLEHVWPTAIRYLRVDRGFVLVDRDEQAGFILFDFPLPGSTGDQRMGRGSLEAFSTKDASGRQSVSVQVSTDAGPLHLPHSILDGLANKLKKERGQPPAPPPAEPKPPKDKGKEPPPEDGPPPDEPPLVLQP